MAGGLGENEAQRDDMTRDGGDVTQPYDYSVALAEAPGLDLRMGQPQSARQNISNYLYQPNSSTTVSQE